MNTKQYETMIEVNTPDGFPNLMCGWPDEEHDITWSVYHDYVKDLVDYMEDGEDAPELPSFKDWCDSERDSNPDRDNLGFYHTECDLCGALPGDRHAATAWNDDMSNWWALKVCGDCLCYIANGDYPDYLED